MMTEYDPASLPGALCPSAVLPMSTKTYGQSRVRARRGRPRHPPRRVPHAARPVGLGQDDDADDARRLRAARPRQHPSRRRGRHAPAAAQARHRHGVPELRAVPAHERRARTSPSRCACAASPRAEIAPTRRRRRWNGAAAAATATAASRSCPAASSSAWRWPARIVFEPQLLLMDEPLSRARQAAARAHADRAAAACTTGSASPSSTSRTTSARR